MRIRVGKACVIFKIKLAVIYWEKTCQMLTIKEIQIEMPEKSFPPLSTSSCPLNLQQVNLRVENMRFKPDDEGEGKLNLY